MENLIYELGTKDAIINERNEEIKKLKEEKHSLYHDKEKLINEIGTKDAIINERNEEIKKLQGNINNERQEKNRLLLDHGINIGILKEKDNVIINLQEQLDIKNGIISKINPISSDSIIIDDSKIIGRGSFSTVVEGSYFGTPVAIKKLTTEINKTIFAKEIQALFTIKHPRCTTILGYLLEPPSIVLNRYAMTLYAFLHKFGVIPLTVKKSLAKDIFAGLQYLHANKNGT